MIRRTEQIELRWSTEVGERSRGGRGSRRSSSSSSSSSSGVSPPPPGSALASLPHIGAVQANYYILLMLAFSGCALVLRVYNSTTS